jgi:SAM-dependent methyltransferase
MSDPSSPPPAAQVMQLLSGCFFAQAVYVTAKLGLADRLAAGPAPAAALAQAVGADEAALARMLRLLVMLGVFQQDPAGRFTNTPLSNALRGDAPDSLRDLAIWWCEEPHWRVYGQLLESVRTGECGWPLVHGTGIFPYLADTNPALGEVFNRAMTSFSSTTIPAVLEAYDFSTFGVVADVGGGRGHLLAAILQANREARGILLDSDAALTEAAALLEQAGVAGRARILTADFFAPPKFTADAIVLKHIIHDWPDDASICILRALRGALATHGRLLILDMVVPEGDSFHLSKICDMEMLVSAGGRERTAAEFRSLLDAAGFRMTRIVPTSSVVSVIEAVPAVHRDTAQADVGQ